MSKVGFVDCHCHLADSQFSDDIDQVIANSKEANVRAIVVVPEFFNQFERVLKLCEKHHNFLFPCLGIHPVQRDQNDSERSAVPDDLINAIPFIDSNIEKLIGIGEVGLDFTPFYTKEEGSKEKQRDVLRKQIELAKKYDIALNVHSRSAGRPTIQELITYDATKVILHAYSGNAKSALVGARSGYFFSIPPCIARSEQKQNLVKALPLDKILLETDSPALGPIKQERNVPANIKISCEWIARLKGISEDEVARVTTENACKLFPAIKGVLQT